MSAAGEDGHRRSRPLGDGAAGTAAHRWPLNRIFAVGAAVTALAVVLAIAAGAVALARLDEARRSLRGEVEPALVASHNLTTALVGQEAAVQAYAHSASDEALARYHDEQRAGEQAVAALQGYLGTGELAPSTAADLAALEQSVQAWRTGFVDGVLAAGGAGDGLSVADVERDWRLFERVQQSSVRLESGLQTQRDLARERVASATELIRGIGITITLVVAAFLVAAGIGLRRTVLRPVSALAEEVRAVVSGDMQRAVRVSGPREIEELGRDVEAMRVRILRELDTVQEVAQELERSNRDLEQFAYVASHDLQEPLRKVSSFCSLLQRRYSGKLDERADQYIEFAVDGAQRMQRLINDLLAFSRVGRTAAFEPVDLGDVARAAVDQLDGMREEAGGRIEIGELPTVQGDPALLWQLLINLVGNALKFRRDDVPPVVELTASPLPPNGWEISVRDNGIGIEPEYAEKVFAIFQRLHGREAYSGTGIGLALAKKIVEFHGGRIWVDTEAAGPGTTLRFTLPAPPGAPPEPSTLEVIP